MDNELFYKLALRLAFELTDKARRQLMERFERIKDIFETKETFEFEFNRTQALKLAEREWRICENENIKILDHDHPFYPKKLKEYPDAPLLLFYKGNFNPNHSRTLSIIGTRNATKYGRMVCKDIIQGLYNYCPLIISGLAYGIDSYAHKDAIDQGLPTVAVLGHGLDRIYPLGHTHLAKQMLTNGGLISEYPSQTKPERHHFPLRNRIIAGMSDLVLVIEAGKKGGALITANLANSYNRDVAAIPGNIYQEYSQGCNELIRTNRAFPIASAKQIADFMNWLPLADKISSPSKKTPETEEQHFLTNLLSREGSMPVDALIEKSGMEISRITLVLLQLELKNIVLKLPGNRYSLVESGFT